MIKDKKNNKSKKNNILFMLLIIFLTSAILCISSFGIATWARYRSIVGGNTVAQIAKWSFKVNGEEEQFADINLADTIAFEHVEKTKIAPGTYGSFDLDIDGRGCEVSLDYYIDMVVENKPTNLKFYTDANYTQPIELTVDNKMYTDGDLLLTEPSMQEIKTIYWKWDYRTSVMPKEDVLDKYLLEIEGLEALIDEYYNTEGTEQQKQEIIMKINDKIDTHEEGGEVKIQVKVKGVQINPNFSLKRIRVTSSKEDIYGEDDTVNFSMEFTENVYGDDDTGSVTNENAPQVTVAFGGTTANNPVAKVAALTQTNLKISEGENLATFVGVEGNKINYSYILKSGDRGNFKVTNITGQVYNMYGKEIDFGTAQIIPEVKGGTVTTGISYLESAPYLEIEDKNIKIQVGESYPLHIRTNIVEERTFTSSKAQVATVNSNGVIHGESIGYAYIRVRGNTSGKRRSIGVRVISPIIELNDCTVSPEGMEIVMGQTGQISVTSNQSGTIEGLTYTSSNTSIATVDSKGKVTAVAVGNTTITITGQTSGQTKTVDVEVTPIARLYGQYVDIGTDILDLSNITLKDNTHPKADWRVFKIDENGGMWLILSLWLDSSNIPENTGLISKSNEIIYFRGVSNRSTTIGILENEEIWRPLIEGTVLENNSNVKVVGAKSKAFWESSWNDNPGYGAMNSSSIGCNDTLYCPAGTGIALYMVTSTPYEDNNVSIYDLGRNASWNRHRYDSQFNIRPFVYIPNTIQFDTSGSVWTLAN